jgi:hypothetical protein
LIPEFKQLNHRDCPLAELLKNYGETLGVRIMSVSNPVCFELIEATNRALGAPTVQMGPLGGDTGQQEVSKREYNRLGRFLERGVYCYGFDYRFFSGQSRLVPGVVEPALSLVGTDLVYSNSGISAPQQRNRGLPNRINRLQ